VGIQGLNTPRLPIEYPGTLAFSQDNQLTHTKTGIGVSRVVDFSN